MSKREKMDEVKQVVDVEATDVKPENNATNEEYMTIRLPKTAAYALLATGEATEVKTDTAVAVVEEEPKKKKFPKPTLKQVLIALGCVAAAGGVASAGYALGKRGGSDDVEFEDVTPKALPDYNNNYQPVYERKTEDVDIEI